MKDIEHRYNTNWLSRNDSANDFNNNQNITLLICIKTEIRNIVTSLKLYKHGGDNSRYNKEIIENLDFSVAYQFQSLLENVLASNKANIECGRLDPFLEVIQSPEFGGNVTATVLNAIDQFILYGIIYIDEPNKYVSINKLVESILNCRFTSSGVESDEIALQKLLDLLVNVVNSEFGEFISSENLIKCVLKCFQISRQPRSTLLLRSLGESSIQKLIVSILSKIVKKEINEREDCCVTLIRIVNFLSMLSFYGIQTIQLDESKIGDTKKEEILKIMKKTVQMDGLDNNSVFEIRRMGLNLLNIAIESGGEQLDKFPEFLMLIQELCINLLLFSLKELSMLQLTFRCLFTIFFNFRSHIKLQMELCLTALHIRIANNGVNKIDLIPINIHDFCFSLEQREFALNSLIEICKDPTFICEIFQNYDCNIYCGNVFQAITRTFVDQFKFEHKHQNKKSNKLTKTLTIFQRLGFNGLTNILKGIYTGIKNNHKNFSEENDINNEIKFQLFLLRQRDMKINLSKLCNLFNENPSNFLEKFKKTGIFNSEITPIELARFFRYAPNIDYYNLGEYLSKNRDWNNSVRSAYMSTFDFSGKSVVASLREVLGTFKLPGESQQIERIMESFSQEFFWQQKINEDSNSSDSTINESTSRVINIFEDGSNEQRSIVLDNNDTIFILSYSIIMLNTDLHNAQVKHKMSVDDFIKNNRGINNGLDLPREFLTSIFNEIKNNGIKLNENHGLIGKQNRHSSSIDIGIWDSWLKKHSLNKLSLDLNNKIERDVTYISIYEEMLNIIVEMGLVGCIMTCLENSSNIQILFKCINGILELVHLCCIFSKKNVINDLIERTSKFINLELSAKSQLILPIFLHIVRITINKWDEDSPWYTLFNVLFMLNSLKLFPQKSIEIEELKDNQGKVISSYSNIQYPRLCFTTRAMTFGMTNGFEYFLELAKNANRHIETNLDKQESNSILKINKNSFSWSEKFISSSSLSNNNWLGDITNILFRSIEEDDEENIRFASEPTKIFDSIIQFIIEEDTMFPDKYRCENIPTPSEIILSWIINGSSPYLAISIYSIIINSVIWEADVSPIISCKNKLLIDSIMVNEKMPLISTGNSWEMLSHYISDSQKIHDILINGIKSIELKNCRKVVDVLMRIIEQFPLSERQNTNSSIAALNIPSPNQNFNSENNQSSEQEIFYLDWGPLLITEKKKVLNFRKISDPLISIGIIMSIVIINVSESSLREININNDFLSSDIWDEIFGFFKRNMMRYSIFTFFNKFDNKLQTDQSTNKDSEDAQDFPRSLSRSDYMFAERIITSSLVLLIHLSRIQHAQPKELTSILQLLLQLHPIIFSLHSEKIIATIQIMMCTERKGVQLIESDNNLIDCYTNCFPDGNSVLLMLGILQRMVYIPPISSLEEKVYKIPEFYPGKLSDPQILVLSSLECIGMWLYNPRYSSLLFDNISLIIQTLITFAIFTPTTLNGRVVSPPLEDDDNIEYNYDANLQAISLTFSLLSVFTNQDSKVLITQVVHTLCIAASFGPNIVRNHTMNRIQQTLGSLHLGSFWFVSDPWIWFELIDACFIPLITFDFRFPFYNNSNMEGDNTSLLLAQYFTLNVAQLVLGAEAVYSRQVHSVTMVSKIILTRIDLLLEPLEFYPANKLESEICEITSEEYSNKRFLLLVPVLVIFVNVLVQNTAGNSSMFFSETLKNIILVVLSTKIHASYQELVTNAVYYFRGLRGRYLTTDLVNILKDLNEGDIFCIIKSIIDSLIKPTLPDIASEITAVVGDIQAQVNIEPNEVLLYEDT